jgi:hypothetical protein
MQESLKIDFRWFFEMFPLDRSDLNEGRHQIYMLDRTCSRPGLNSAPAPSELPIEKPKRFSFSQGADSPDLPPLQPFRQADYDRMVQYVDQSLKRWNTWTYQLPSDV